MAGFYLEYVLPLTYKEATGEILETNWIGTVIGKVNASGNEKNCMSSADSQ